MSGRTRLWFTIIVVIAFAAMMITFMPTQTISFPQAGININTSLRQGLDLSGGSQVIAAFWWNCPLWVIRETPLT